MTDSTYRVTEPPQVDLRYLQPGQVQVFRSPDGQVRATIGQERSVLHPCFLRACPLSDPDRYLSIREENPRGRELGLLAHWRDLPPEARRLVEEALSRRYLYPVVLALRSVENLFGVAVVVFATDRGVRESTLRDIRDNVVFLGEGRVLITDAEGNRFDIPDLARLDPLSRKRLAQII